MGEQDLELDEAALAEAQTWELKPWVNHDELMEVVELQRLLQDIEADRVIEATWLATLVRDVSKVLVDLGLPPIPVIPWDPRIAGDVLEVVDIILERLQEAYASSHELWDQALLTHHHCHPHRLSCTNILLCFCFTFLM
jgi:hypothetical protein